MTRCVVDTTVASLLLRMDPRAPTYIRAMRGAERLISFQTVAEMRFGALRAGWAKGRRDGLERSLLDFVVVGYSDALATSWAEVMASSERAGARLEAGDGWVAATALHLAVPLITDDADFVRACPMLDVVCFA
jgi:predicted nucleic acid-binding protein